MRLGRTTLVYFLTQFTITVAGFGATFFIARFMGAAALGSYATALALVFWLNVPTTAVAKAVNKRISEANDPGGFIGAGVTLNLMIAAFGGAGIVLFATQLERYFGIRASHLVAFLFVMMVLTRTVYESLKGQKRVAVTGVIEAVERVLRTGFQIGLVVVSGYGVGGLLLGHASSFAIATGLGILFFRVRPGVPTRYHFHRLVEYARYSWLGILETRAFGWMDTIMLGFFVTSNLVGIYEASWTLASVLGLISVSVRQTLFPEVSDLSARDDYDRIHSILSDGIAFSGIFAIPGLFGAALLGPELLKIYRPEFTRGGTVLLVLILARLFAAYGSQLKSIINAVDRPDVAFRINALFVVSNLVLNASLVWQFGWTGAAVATATSGAFALVVSYFALSRIIGSVRIPYTELLRQVTAGVVMFVVLFGSKSVVPTGHFWTLGLVGLGAATYVLVLLAISEFTRQKAVGLLPFDVTTG